MIQTNFVIDAKGLACPMPIVKTKKALNELEAGQVLEVQATDKGSTADIKAWAESTGNQYLGTVEQDAVLKHYIRKAHAEERKEETAFPHVITNEELLMKIHNGESMTILDVREPAEYAFGHIPGAVSIPLGELDAKAEQLNAADTIYVICRTGTRSDMAAQQLSEKGFSSVYNIVPGMSAWNGPTETVSM